MRFFSLKNYFYSRKLRAEAIEKTQKNIGMIHSVLVAALAADKEEADRVEERHKEFMEFLKVNDEQMTRQIFELKESLDNFIKSQSGMISVIQEYFKIEVDSAIKEAGRKPEEPTPHDMKF